MEGKKFSKSSSYQIAKELVKKHPKAKKEWLIQRGIWEYCNRTKEEKTMPKLMNNEKIERPSKFLLGFYRKISEKIAIDKEDDSAFFFALGQITAMEWQNEYFRKEKKKSEERTEINAIIQEVKKVALLQNQDYLRLLDMRSEYERVLDDINKKIKEIEEKQ